MDPILVERAMAGDRDAFNELARLSIARLYGIAQLNLRDPDRAWDATQEALVASWRDLSALRDPDRFDAWLYRILVRTCQREARRVRQRRTVEVRELPLVEHAGSDELPACSIETSSNARSAGSASKNGDRVLHHVEGFPLSEIAAILGLPIGTVKSRLHRGIQTMRAALDADARVVSIDGERIA